MEKVTGVREALAELRTTDRALYLELRKGIREAVEPMRAAAAANLGTSPPLSGMARGRTAWTKLGTAVKTVLMGRTPRDRELWPVARVKLAGPAASMYDMAGKGSPGSRFVASLTAAGAPAPSRAMWPAAEAHLSDVEAATRAAVDRVGDASSRRLEWRG